MIDQPGPVIGVTGAAGRLGRRAAARLADRLPPERLVLVTRRPGELSTFADRGIAVRRADFDRPDTVERAFQGVRRLLLVSASDLGRRAVQHRAAITAAGHAGVIHVVYTSLGDPWLPGSPIAEVTDDHRDTEEVLRSFPSATILRNATYGDLLVGRWASAVAAGRLPVASGTGRTAYVSRDDCADVAAEALLDPSLDGSTLDVTGADRQSADDLARALEAWSGRPITVVPIAADELAMELAAAGAPEPVARLVAAWDLAIAGGYLDQCSTAVYDVIGRPPRSVADLMAAHPLEPVDRSRAERVGTGGVPR